jgi:hypothetical protein
MGARRAWLIVIPCIILIGATGATHAQDEYQAAVDSAERLRKDERWREAGDAFLRALRLRPRSADAESIALNAIEMHSNFHDLQCSAEPNQLREQPITGQLARLFVAYDAYLDLFPKTEVGAKIRYRKASQLESCKHFREAAELYKEVGLHYPELELAPYANEAYRRCADGARRQKRQKPRSRDKGAPSHRAVQPGIEPDGPPARGLAPER